MTLHRVSPGMTVAQVNALTLAPGDRVEFDRGGVWRGNLTLQSGTPVRPITYGARSGTGPLPLLLGSRALPATASLWVSAGGRVWQTAFAGDPCNLIFDGEQSCGRKRHTLALLERQGDYYGSGTALYLYSALSPALWYSQIEVAQKGPPGGWGTMNARGKTDLLIQDLDFRYAGMGALNLEHEVQRIVVQRCSLSWIGGVTWRADTGVRAGNAVQIWQSGRDIVVRGCRFDQVFDAAISPQADEELSSNWVERMWFYCNAIDRTEYAFEGWNRNRLGTLRDIVFAHNVCRDNGGGWGHNQRIGDVPRGEAFMLSTSYAQSSGCRIVNNIVERSAEAHWYKHATFRGWDEIEIDYNCYWPDGPRAFAFAPEGAGDAKDWLSFADHLGPSGKDAHSICADPRLQSDLRPSAESPVIGRGTWVVGALQEPVNMGLL